MKTTRRFDEQVRRKRPYLHLSWCSDVAGGPLRREVQPDGRVRYWGKIRLRGKAEPQTLRVGTLADGETAHNAFLRRGFRSNQPRNCITTQTPTAST